MKGEDSPSVTFYVNEYDYDYDLSDVKVTKRKPLTLEHFDEFFELLPSLAESERSWTVERAAVEARDYDLKTVNPNAIAQGDSRTPEELIALIEEKGREVTEALERLKRS